MLDAFSEGESLEHNSDDDSVEEVIETKDKGDLLGNKNDIQNEDSDDSYMVPVAKDKNKADSESEEGNIGEQPLKASRSALRTITKDGPFGGKNR
jgi:hypothetical protein